MAARQIASTNRVHSSVRESLRAAFSSAAALSTSAAHAAMRSATLQATQSLSSRLALFETSYGQVCRGWARYWTGRGWSWYKVSGSEEETFQLILRVSADECAERCSALASCYGYESMRNERCELWRKSPPATATAASNQPQAVCARKLSFTPVGSSCAGACRLGGGMGSGSELDIVSANSCLQCASKCAERSNCVAYECLEGASFRCEVWRVTPDGTAARNDLTSSTCALKSLFAPSARDCAAPPRPVLSPPPPPPPSPAPPPPAGYWWWGYGQWWWVS